MKAVFLSAAVFLFMMNSIYSQSASAANQDKVSSLDAIIETLYSVISGDAGVKRDWNLFKFLFAENARLMPTVVDENGNVTLVDLSPGGYIERSGKWLEENGFFEKEIARKTDSFGSMTHIFSTYESYRKLNDKDPFARGINSIQLLNDGKRWWIVSIYWVSESNENPIPTRYLPKD